MSAVLSKVAISVEDIQFGGVLGAGDLIDPTAALLAKVWALGYQGVAGTSFALPNTRAAAWAYERAGELITGLAKTTHDDVLARLRSILGDTLSDPDVSAAELGDEVGALFDDMADWRADMIARTETTMAANAGSLTGGRDMGIAYVEVTDGDDFDEECLVGGTIVTAARVERVYARQAQGQVIDFRTAAGDLFTATPNHPVLTPGGWVAAGLLHEGDEVLRAVDHDRLLRATNPGCPDEHYVPTRIEEMVDLALKSGEWFAVVKPTIPHDFHGDGRDSEIHVVATNRELRNRVEPSGSQEFLQAGLVRALVGAGAVAAPGGPGQALVGVMPAAPRGVSGRGPGQPLLSGCGRVSSDRGGRPIANRQSGPSVDPDDAPGRDAEFPAERVAGLARQIARMGRENVSDGRLPGRTGLSHDVPSRGELPREGAARDRELLAEPPERDPGLVEATRLVHVERKAFQGHVYNLGTHSGWYLADSVILHNCRTADGSVWSLDYAMTNLVQHPDCARSFSMLPTEQALATGVDEE